METQVEEDGQPAVSNPLSEDDDPVPEPREEEDDWVTLSVAPQMFARVGRWLSAADGAPTPLAWALYAILGLYPPYFFFIGFG